MMSGPRPASTLTQDELEMQVEEGNYASSAVSSNIGNLWDQELTLHPVSQINTSAYNYNTRHGQEHINRDIHTKELSSFPRDGLRVEAEAVNAERGELNATSERAGKRIRLNETERGVVASAEDPETDGTNPSVRATVSDAKLPQAGADRGVVDSVEIDLAVQVRAESYPPPSASTIRTGSTSEALTLQGNMQSNFVRANRDTLESTERDYRAMSNTTLSTRTSLSALSDIPALSEPTVSKAGSPFIFGERNAGYSAPNPKFPISTHPTTFTPSGESQSRTAPPSISYQEEPTAGPAKRARAQKAKSKGSAQTTAPNTSTAVASTTIASNTAPAARPPTKRSRKRKPPTELMIIEAEPKLSPLKWRTWHIETRMHDIASGFQEIAASFDTSSVSSSADFSNQLAEISRSLNHLADYTSIPLRGMTGCQEDQALAQFEHMPNCEERYPSKFHPSSSPTSGVWHQEDARAVNNFWHEQTIPSLAGSSFLAVSSGVTGFLGQAPMSQIEATRPSQIPSSLDRSIPMVPREVYAQLHEYFLACHTKHAEAVQDNWKLKTQVQQLTRNLERKQDRMKEYETYKQFWAEHNLVSPVTGLTQEQTRNQKLGIAERLIQKLKAEAERKDETVKKCQADSSLLIGSIKNLENEVVSKDKELGTLRAELIAKDQELGSLKAAFNKGPMKASTAKLSVGLMLPGMGRGSTNPPIDPANVSPGGLLLPGISHAPVHSPVAIPRPAVSPSNTTPAVSTTLKDFPCVKAMPHSIAHFAVNEPPPTAAFLDATSHTTTTCSRTATAVASIMKAGSAARCNAAPPRLILGRASLSDSASTPSAIAATQSASASEPSSSNVFVDLTGDDDDVHATKFRPMKRGAKYDWLPKKKKPPRPEPYPSDRRRSRDAAASAAASREGSVAESSAESVVSREGSMPTQAFVIDDDDYFAAKTQEPTDTSSPIWAVVAAGVASTVDAISAPATGVVVRNSSSTIARAADSSETTAQLTDTINTIDAAEASSFATAVTADEVDSGDTDDELEKMFLDHLAYAPEETKEADTEDAEKNMDSLFDGSFGGEDGAGGDDHDSLFDEPMADVE